MRVARRKKRKNLGLLLGSFIFGLPSAFDEAILVTMEVTRILMRSWPKTYLESGGKLGISQCHLYSINH